MLTRSGTKYGAPPNFTILRQNVDKSQSQLMDNVIIDLGEMPIDDITAHIGGPYFEEPTEYGITGI